MKKRVIVMIGTVLLFWGCHQKEQARLNHQIDSLKTELSDKQELTMALGEIGTMIDSIDARRNLLNANMVEGTTYDDYASRLESINNYVREAQEKIDNLEGRLKKSTDANSWYAGTLNKLRGELDSRSEQIAALQEEVSTMQAQNEAMATRINEQDQVLAQRLDSLTVKEGNIRSMEARLEEMKTVAQSTKADLYYSYAQAMEIAADRTHFARKKKKATWQKALELYRISYSLGKEEAQPRIEELEDELS